MDDIYEIEVDSGDGVEEVVVEAHTVVEVDVGGDIDVIEIQAGTDIAELEVASVEVIEVDVGMPGPPGPPGSAMQWQSANW